MKKSSHLFRNILFFLILSSILLIFAYYLYITSSNTKPDISSLDSSEKILLKKEKNKLVSLDPSKIAGKVELNQDLYATVVECNIKGKESKFDDIEEVNKVINSINSNEGKIIDKKVTTSKEYAPKLFSLTSLQGYITSKYSNFT